MKFKVQFQPNKTRSNLLSSDSALFWSKKLWLIDVSPRVQYKSFFVHLWPVEFNACILTLLRKKTKFKSILSSSPPPPPPLRQRQQSKVCFQVLRRRLTTLAFPHHPLRPYAFYAKWLDVGEGGRVMESTIGELSSVFQKKLFAQKALLPFPYKLFFETSVYLC